MEIIKREQAAEFDAFVKSHYKASFMQGSPWAGVKKNWQWRGVISRGEDGKIDGTMALLIRKVPGMPYSPLDYGKYRFEQQKKEKEAKKNQKVVEVKETRLSLNIDTNDFNTKLNQTAKFLAAGHKVKVSIRFRGREMAHSALGADVLKRFAEALPQASTDKPPVLEGRTMSILLIPKPNKD